MNSTTNNTTALTMAERIAKKHEMAKKVEAEIAVLTALSSPEAKAILDKYEDKSNLHIEWNQTTWKFNKEADVKTREVSESLVKAKTGKFTDDGRLEIIFASGKVIPYPLGNLRITFPNKMTVQEEIEAAVKAAVKAAAEVK